MKTLLFLQQKIKSPSVIGFLIACGIYLMGGAWFASIFSSKPISIQRNGDHTISLKLSSVDSGGDQKLLSKTPPAPKLIKKATKKPKPKAKAPTTTPSTPTPPLQEQPTQASNTTQEGANAETLAYNQGVSDEFLSQIHIAISNHNSYPRIARIRRLQGRILLEFILDIDGGLSGLQIVQSNAGNILEQTALKAVRSASNDFPTPKQKVRIRVPIIYNLKGGHITPSLR